MKNKLFLGIDTSNYTTSVAVVDIDGNCLANIKKPLPVKSGACGLRQSDAVFFHTQNLPEAMRAAEDYLNVGSLAAIGVSEKPRNVDGSYMPCFLSGVAAATAASVASGARLYRFSHQCGHLMAALHSSGREDFKTTTFGAFHVSGGTTELVRAHFDGAAFETELVGGTADLNAGQAIDRIGVLMGLPFPAGPSMEALAKQNTKKLPPRKLSVKGTYVHLSGLENLATKLYNETHDKPLVAAFTLTFIAEALTAMSRAYIETYGAQPLLYAGGVMSNGLIKTHIRGKFDAAFAEPAFSADNAVGIALLARHTFLQAEENA